VIERYGADALRLFILFAAPPEDQLEWNDGAIDGAWKFLNRVHMAVSKKFVETQTAYQTSDFDDADKELYREIHASIKKVTYGFSEDLKFNTAISQMMILMNALEKYGTHGSAQKQALFNEALKIVVVLLAPIAPHLCEELWQQIGGSGSIAKASWPSYQEEALVQSDVLIVVQVNGKVRGKVEAHRDMSEEALRALVLSDEKVSASLQGKAIRKFIVVPNRIVSIVI